MEGPAQAVFWGGAPPPAQQSATPSTELPPAPPRARVPSAPPGSAVSLPLEPAPPERAVVGASFWQPTPTASSEITIAEKWIFIRLRPRPRRVLHGGS